LWSRRQFFTAQALPGSAAKIIAGIETMHMVKKRQLRCPQGVVVSGADRFYSLVAR